MPWILDFAVEEHRSKGSYKSESSLMTCEAELHGSVTRMACSILSLMGMLMDSVGLASGC